MRCEWCLGQWRSRCSGVSGYVGHHGQSGESTIWSLWRCPLSRVCPIRSLVMAVSTARSGEYMHSRLSVSRRRSPRVLCRRASVSVVFQCSLQVVMSEVMSSVCSEEKAMGEGWECASAAALSATVLPSTPTWDGTHCRWTVYPAEVRRSKRWWMERTRP